MRWCFSVQWRQQLRMEMRVGKHWQQSILIARGTVGEVVGSRLCLSKLLLADVVKRARLTLVKQGKQAQLQPVQRHP